MDDHLIDQIRTLSDDLALEALQLYATSQRLGGPDADETDLPPGSEALLGKEGLADAARIALLLGATGDADQRGAVERALDGAGRKQFILEGTVLVSLALAAVQAYRLHQTKGRKLEKHSQTTITIQPDGTTTMTRTDDVIEYETASPVVDAITGLFGRS